MSDDSAASKKALIAMSLRKFFTDCPPGSTVEVSPGPSDKGEYYNINRFFYELPILQLHCSSIHCNSTRLFGPVDESVVYLTTGTSVRMYVVYRCRNCSSTEKTYSLTIVYNHTTKKCVAYKYGELPNFGPPIPARVISLIGPDRELFLKGMRCENQGLGIAAFAYFRRVVENQKDRLLDEIIKVCRTMDAPAEHIELMERAKTEPRFTKSVEMLKDAVPDVLKIQGHNPLTLLHGPLSGGIHDYEEEECLRLATSIRAVLFDLVERIAEVQKDNAELRGAVSNLLKKKSDKKKCSPE